MVTGDQFANFTTKRVLGVADFRERLIDYVRGLVGDFHDVAFGLDGVFGGVPITMSAGGHGNDRFQLDNDLTCSDGDGHFIETDAALAYRDVGLAFENANAVVYSVGLKSEDRPRGVQINPRTTEPEFVALEETIGEKADPTSVVDNGDGTMTFNVNSVADPFTTGVLTHAGRKCLVWKKTPGPSATTEAAAIEELIVAFAAGNNTITTTLVGAGGAGTFGQPAGFASTTPSDYEVLMLGPTVTRQAATDLDLEVGYVFIGEITGNGPAAVPATFNVAQQNDLSSGFAIDINDITRGPVNGRLKVSVSAHPLDSAEPQIDVRNSTAAIAFQVHEEGQTSIGPTVTPVATNQLHVGYDPANPRQTQLDGVLQLGSALAALAEPAQTQTARLSMLNNTGALYALAAMTGTSGLPIYVYADQNNGRFMVAINAIHNGNVAASWDKHASFPNDPAYVFELHLDQATTGAVFLKTRYAGSAGGWIDDDTDGGATNWDKIVSLSLPDSFAREIQLFGLAQAGLQGSEANGLASGDAILRLGELSETDTGSGAAHWRIRANAVTNGGGDYTPMWISESGAGVAPANGHWRLYSKAAGGFALTQNAEITGASWDKDQIGNAATKFEMADGHFSVYQREQDLVGPFNDGGWREVFDIDGASFNTTTVGPIITALFQSMNLNGGAVSIGNIISAIGANLDFTAASNNLSRIALQTPNEGANRIIKVFDVETRDSGGTGTAHFRVFVGNTLLNNVLGPVLTMNADWDHNTSNWVADDATRGSWRLELGDLIDDSIRFELKEAGSAPWALGAWDRTSFFWNYSFSQDINTLQSRGLLILDQNPGPQGNPTPTTSILSNSIIAKLIPKAWVWFEIPASAGVTRTILDGVNIDSVVDNGQNTRITIHTSADSANELAPLITHVSGFEGSDVTWHSEIVNHQDDRIDLVLTVDSVQQDQSTLTEAVRVMVAFYGTVS